MTTSLTLRSLAAALLIIAMALVVMTPPQAHAQSEVTGTLTSGAAATGSTATGTITGGGGNTLTGTVVEDDNGGGGGGGSSRNRNNNNDDDGDVLGTSTDIPSGVGGGGDFPGVPNTGLGGAAPLTWGVLLGSLLLMIGGGVALARGRFS